MTLKSIGKRLRDRRQMLGLSQAELAHIARVSRTTVNELEMGRIAELGFNRLQEILHPLGLNLAVMNMNLDANKDHLALAATTASVSLKKSLPPAILKDALISGKIPPEYLAHVGILIDEVDESVLLGAAAQAALDGSVAPKVVWKHLKSWAHAMHSPRLLWA